VIDAHDVDGPGGLVDPVDHSVGAAPCRVVSGWFMGEWPACPVRVVQQCAGQELGDCCRDCYWQSAMEAAFMDEHVSPPGRVSRFG